MESAWLSDLIREIQLIGMSSRPFEPPPSTTMQALERLSPPLYPFEEAIGRYLLLRLLVQLGRFSNERLVCLKSGWAEDLITARDWRSFKQECLQSISAGVNTEETPDESLVRRATEVILTNIRSVTVVTLARRLTCHRRTLERAFRRVRNQSVHQFVVRLRTQAAIDLLVKTDLKCEAIARDVGFRSRTTLNAAVKQTTGYTPRQLRASAAAGRVARRN
jgi:AraC-like DNA-binding protein